MAQDIVVNYRADVDDLTNKLKVVIERMDKLEKESVASAKGIDQVTKSTDKLDKELSTLGTSSKKATDNIKGFSKTAKTSLNEVGSSVKSIGLGIAASLGAAFTVDAVIQFGKASVNAFLEAQENAEKLRFTITQVGGESEAAFQRLIDQSAQLQDITIFSDDSIQQAQAALSTFGLTANQIEELLPLLADFSSATKTDIASAAQAVGAGLQGAGREFKKFGIEVSATKTPVENLAQITEGFARFQGAAAKETETLTGQLKQQANAADELQEELGSKLAPIFVKLRVALFEATLGLLGFNKATEDFAKENTDAIANNFEKAAEKIKAAGGDIVTAFQERLDRLKESNQKTLQEIDRFNDQLGSRQTSNLQKQIARDQIETNQEIIRQNDIKIRQIEAIISREQGLQEEIRRTLTAEQLRTESFDDLNKLLIENQKLNDTVSQSNVRLIENEIAARKKQTEELEKEAAKQLEALKKLYGDVQKIPPIELKVKFDTEDPDKSINPLPDTLELPPVDAGEFNDSIEAVEAKTLEGWLDNNAQMLDATQQLVGSLLELWDMYAQNQISKINDETQLELKALDEQSKANDTALKKRAVSEKEFAENQKRIEAEKIKTQADADKKIRDIKRKQFLAQKAAALAEIIISTAKNVVEFPNLAAFYLAIGAAQGAIVAAQPVPYRRGSKDTGAKGHLAKVGEEGEEIVYMPPHSKVLPTHRTRTYGDVLDKMFEGTFDKHYMKRDISSSLVSQRRNFEEKKEKSFAQNIKESIIYQQDPGRADYFLERIAKSGVDIKNIDKLMDGWYDRNRQSPKR